MLSKDEVIEMARETGALLERATLDKIRLCFLNEQLQRFATACYQRGIEDAAKVCDGTCNVNNCLNDEEAYYGREMAKAVRKLGETE